MIYKNKLIETIKYTVKATSISPVSIRDNSDFLKIDVLTGKVYIPGSSIAGAFRNYYESYINTTCGSDNNRLFGGAETGISRLVFYDAFLVENTNKEMLASRPGIKIDSEKMSVVSSGLGSKKSGHKFKRQFLNKGIRFLFSFELNNYEDECDFVKTQKEFEDLLRALAVGDISFGSNKMIGYGRFEINSVSKSIFDLRNFNDMFKYLLKETKDVEITEDIVNNGYLSSKVHFRIIARATTPLLIKDEVVRSSDEPDSKNITDNKGNCIIPGSSLKGVLRSRAEKLAKTFPKIDKQVISNIFGIESKEDEGCISRFCCFDTEIRDEMKGIYNKIKIDYFTGGVVQNALMNEETVMGNMEIECTFNTFGLEEYESEIGLLLLVIRDLCLEDLNVGSGYAVGRGYIKASKLTLFDGHEMVYDFDSPDKQVEEQFNSYISKLMSVG